MGILPSPRAKMKERDAKLHTVATEARFEVG